ncbi:hypothetical protein LguiB_000156 [Lonicera macranthoides]
MAPSQFLNRVGIKEGRPIKVHGSIISTAAMRVFACLNEKDLDFDFVPVDLQAGEHKKGSFLSLNKDHKKMAILSVWAEVGGQKFDPAALKLTFELAIKPLIGKATDHAVVEEYKAKLVKILDVYEARLAQSKYLAGDCFTLHG